MKIVIKGIVEEDFINYQKCSMFVAFPHCTFKCDKEFGTQICQNCALAHEPDLVINAETIVENYLKNPLSKALVCGGLEPFDSWVDLYTLISVFRSQCKDDIVIYTGYAEDEIKVSLDTLRQFDNIIVKFGRYIPDQESHFDKVLGVKLASSNQYAKWL